MSPRLDLPVAVVAWLLGFLGVRLTGSWAPLAVLATLGAARLLLGDPATRRLLQPRLGHLLLGVAGAAALAGATLGLYRPLAGVFPALPGATRDLYGVLNAGGYRPPVLGALVLWMSACEEVVWRGRTLCGAGRLDRAALRRVAGLALLYGAATLPSGSLLLCALSCGCGLSWGLLRALGGSLWPPIVAHAAWDLAVLVAWPLA